MCTGTLTPSRYTPDEAEHDEIDSHKCHCPYLFIVFPLEPELYWLDSSVCHTDLLQLRCIPVHNRHVPAKKHKASHPSKADNALAKPTQLQRACNLRSFQMLLNWMEYHLSWSSIPKRIPNGQIGLYLSKLSVFLAFCKDMAKAFLIDILRLGWIFLLLRFLLESNSEMLESS